MTGDFVGDGPCEEPGYGYYGCPSRERKVRELVEAAKLLVADVAPHAEDYYRAWKRLDAAIAALEGEPNGT